MDASSVLSWWSFVFLGYCLWVGGQVAKGFVRTHWEPKGLPLRVYDRTVGFHAPAIGLAVASLTGFPVPSDIPSTPLARALFGLVCGLTCAHSHKAVRRLLGVDSGSASNA